MASVLDFPSINSFEISAQAFHLFNELETNGRFKPISARMTTPSTPIPDEGVYVYMPISNEMEELHSLAKKVEVINLTPPSSPLHVSLDEKPEQYVLQNFEISEVDMNKVRSFRNMGKKFHKYESKIRWNNELDKERCEEKGNRKLKFSDKVEILQFNSLDKGGEPVNDERRYTIGSTEDKTTIKKAFSKVDTQEDAELASKYVMAYFHKIDLNLKALQYLNDSISSLKEGEVNELSEWTSIDDLIDKYKEIEMKTIYHLKEITNTIKRASKNKFLNVIFSENDRYLFLNLYGDGSVSKKGILKNLEGLSHQTINADKLYLEFIEKVKNFSRCIDSDLGKALLNDISPKTK